MRQGKGYLNLNYLFLLDWNQRTWLRKEHVIFYMTQDRPRIPYSMKCFNVEKLCKFMQCHSNTQENMISVVCISAWNCLNPGAWPEIRLAGKGNHSWKGPKKSTPFPLPDSRYGLNLNMKLAFYSKLPMFPVNSQKKDFGRDRPILQLKLRTFYGMEMIKDNSRSPE